MKKMLPLVAALFAAATSALADLYVTPTGAGNKDGSSWANAYAGIQAAVDAVDAAYATTDLTDWSHPEVKTLTISDNGTLIFDHATDPQRFYRLKAVEE